MLKLHARIQIWPGKTSNSNSSYSKPCWLAGWLANQASAGAVGGANLLKTADKLDKVATTEAADPTEGQPEDRRAALGAAVGGAEHRSRLEECALGQVQGETEVRLIQIGRPVGRPVSWCWRWR